MGVGESGCAPPAQSLISDYFDREERPRAMAVYWLCMPIATLLSYVGGGWLIEQLGWRTTFLLIGLPGILLAIMVKLTLKEPRLSEQRSIKVIQQPSTQEVLSALWKNNAFRHLVIGNCVVAFFAVGFATWVPAFFIRSHGMDVATVGTWLGLGIGLGGLLFTFLGGYWATRYAPHREGLQIKCAAVLVVFCSLFQSICFLSSDNIAALVFVLIIIGGLMPLMSAPFFSAIQSLVEPRMRAMAMACVFLVSHLLGMGLGPLVVGFASDVLEPNYGQESLRNALLFLSPGFIWGAFHYWKAAKTIEQDIRTAEMKAELDQVQSSPAEPGSMPYSMSNSSIAN